MHTYPAIMYAASHSAFELHPVYWQTPLGGLPAALVFARLAPCCTTTTSL